MKQAKKGWPCHTGKNRNIYREQDHHVLQSCLWLPERVTGAQYPACNKLRVLVATILSTGHNNCASLSLQPTTPILASDPSAKATVKRQKKGDGLAHVPFFSCNEGKEMPRTRSNVISSVNASEREGKRAKTSSPCTRVPQGDNNYFLLPSSVTLPAGPSLETLHGTHGSKTKHERRGSESVRQKGIRCGNKKIKHM